MGGNDTPEGTFTCIARVTNDPSPAQTYAGKVINKTIESKATLTDDNRRFANGPAKPTRKFSRVIHNDGNNTFRDTYKGSLAKDARWDHAGGTVGANNVAVPNAFAVDAPVIAAPAAGSADQLNAVAVNPVTDKETIEHGTEFAFTDGAEALLNGDLPDLYTEWLDALTEEYGEENELLFRHLLETAQSFDEFIDSYDDIMITIQEPGDDGDYGGGSEDDAIVSGGDDDGNDGSQLSDDD